MARLAHGEHRKVHMRSEHQHRWHPSAKGRRQGLVPSLWYHYGPPPLNDSYELAVGQALTEFACIGMLMVVPHPRQEE